MLSIKMAINCLRIFKHNVRLFMIKIIISGKVLCLILSNYYGGGRGIFLNRQC